MLADEVVDCHVLVIGSGGAGVRAAIEASQHGDTVLISKTIVGKGGCTTMAEGGFNAVMRDEDSCGIHFEDTMKGGAFLNDPELVNILVKEAPLRMGDLVKWGAVFDFTDSDEVAQRPFGGQRFPRTCYAGDRTGHEMMVTLVEHLDGTDVTTLQEYTVIDLLKDGDRVIGAMALDEKGNLVLLKADSTILATGGGTKVFDISTNSSSGTGDGYAIGYRAGAELIDMEMIQFHPTGAVFPYDARGRLVTEAVRGEGGLLLNSKGERFMKVYDPQRMELAPGTCCPASNSDPAGSLVPGRGGTDRHGDGPVPPDRRGVPVRCPGPARDRSGPRGRRPAPQQQRRAVHEGLRPPADGTLDPGRGCPGDRNRDPAGEGEPERRGVPRRHPPAPGTDRDRLPVMLEQFLEVRRGHPRDTHGSGPDRPPHHGRAPDHARVPDNPARDCSRAAKCPGECTAPTGSAAMPLPRRRSSAGGPVMLPDGRRSGRRRLIRRRSGASRSGSTGS